jgi:hypothetical protein
MGKSIPLVAFSPISERTAAASAATATEDCLTRFLKARSSTSAPFAFGILADTHLLVSYYQDERSRHRIRAADVLLAANRRTAWLIHCLYGRRVPVYSTLCLTRKVFETAKPTDRILWLGRGVAGIRALAASYHLSDVRFRFETAVDDGFDPHSCVQFVEENTPFDVCLLALQAPANVLIAQSVLMRQRAKGLAFCLQPLVDGAD